MTYFHGLCATAVILLWICVDAISNYATGVLA